MNNKIGILIKTSFVDYPGIVSCCVFLNGCNLQCPYCYNIDLVKNTLEMNEEVSLTDIEAHLIKRKKLIKGITISGGEALLSPYLEQLITIAKENNYLVKLDTNGIADDKLEQLIQNNTLKPDFIALDIKTSPKKYNLLGKIDVLKMEASLKHSINLVSNYLPTNREFRTVLVPTLIQKEDIINIANLLPKDASWQFAQFRNENCLDPKYCEITPYSQKQIEELIDIGRSIIPGATLR